MPVTKISFREEIENMFYAGDGNPLTRCIQCGTCSSTCPAAPFMDYSPRKIIEMIRRGLKIQVLKSNTFWMCTSCYSCTVKCPAGIRITDLMYALKRYALWHNTFKEETIAPELSKAFVRMILESGKAYEPGLAPIFIFKQGLNELINHSRMGLGLLLKRRLPLTPKKIKRLENFRKVLGKIVLLEE
ncbi:MAG: 4Fe-4S dicluster domain-containing protein [bacterium JZ-2024 1]